MAVFRIVGGGTDQDGELQSMRTEGWEHEVAPYVWGSGMDGVAGVGDIEADEDIDQIGITANVSYKVRERFVVYGGVRYNDVDATVKVTGPLGNTERGSSADSWLDPIVSASCTWPINDQWSTTLQGNIGGFDMDFESGHGHGRFMYDIATSGPALGIALKF